MTATATAAAPAPTIPPKVRCDRCNARPVSVAHIGPARRPLYFCGHHADHNRAALEAQGADVTDTRHH